MERVRVGDVLRLERQPVDPNPLEEYTTIGVRSFGRGIFHYDPVPGAQLGKLRFFELQPDRLVISNIKGWEGAVAVSRDLDADCLASSRFLTYAPIDDRIDVRWARWFFLSDAGLPLIQQASPGSADRNRTLAINRFEAIEIPLPPIEEQRAQAAYLERISGWTSALERRLNLTTPQALLAILPTITDALIEDASSGESPVGGVADFVSDTVHPGQEPGPAESFVGLQHIESHTGRRLASDPLGEMKGRKFRFRPGDVVYGYLRPYLNKVWVADRNGLCSVDQYVLRPRPGVSADLLAYSLRGQKVLSRAIELTHSLQLPRLRSGLLASLEVPMVPESELGPLVERLDEARHRVVELAAKRAHQGSLIGALLPAASNRAFGHLN
jgi:hypothetical protein